MKITSGMVRGRMTVVRPLGFDEWLCRCRCLREVAMSEQSVRKSTGCSSARCFSESMAAPLRHAEAMVSTSRSVSNALWKARMCADRLSARLAMGNPQRSEDLR